MKYGNYKLTLENKVYTKTFREMQGAERDLTILKTVGTRGVKVLSSTFEGKVLELTGEIITSDTDTLRAAVRTFVRELSRNGQPLTIENAEGTFVYDNVYVTNFSDLIETRVYDNQRWAEFRILFLCPKGFARSATQLIQTNSGITALPYSDSIEIDGDTNPQPIIEFTLVDSSTIEDLYFTNTTPGVNQQISVIGQDFEDGDVVTIDIANGQVLLNTTPISFEGVFPEFIPGLNTYQITAGGGASNIVLDQSQYNSEISVYDQKEIAQSFELASGADISQIGLLVKKVFSPSSETYEARTGNATFSDMNSSRWGVTGTAKQNSGSAIAVLGRVGGTGVNTTAITDGKTDGDPIVGYLLGTINLLPSGHNNGTNRIELTNGTDYIRWQKEATGWRLSSGGAYGSSDVFVAGESLNSPQVLKSGGNTEVYSGGVLRQVYAIPPAANSYFLMSATGYGNGSGETYAGIGSGVSGFCVTGDVTFYYEVAELEDLMVEIQTDTAGDPSGTEVTNAVITIPASEIGTSFTDIIKQFTTEPTLAGTTTYHVRVFQVGGDLNNYYVIKKQNTDVLADGNLETTVDGGVNWTQVTGEDMYVKLWSTLPTSFDIDLAIKYYPSYFNII